MDRGGARVFLVLGEVARDGVDDHDRRIGEHADGHHQPEEADHVQRGVHRPRLPAEVHDDEGGDDRERDGHRHQQGGAHLLQEEQQDDHGQPAAEEAGEGQLGQSAAHVERRVLDVAHLDPVVAGDGGDLVHLRLDPVGDLQHVRVGRLVDAERDRLFAVEVVEGGLGRELVGDVGDVAQPQPAVADRRFADVLGPLELSDSADDQLARAVGDGAAGDIDVVLGKHRRNVADVHIQRRHPGLVHADPQFPPANAPDIHAGHSLEALEPRLHDVFGKVEEAFPLPGRPQMELENGDVGALEPPDVDALDVVGQQVTDPVHPVAGLHHHEVHVRPLVELHADVAALGPRGGGEDRDPGNGPQALFQWADDETLGLLGRGGLVVDAHPEAVGAERGQELEGEPSQRDVAEHDQPDRDHADRHPPVHGEAGQEATPLRDLLLVVRVAVSFQSAHRPIPPRGAPSGEPSSESPSTESRSRSFRPRSRIRASKVSRWDSLRISLICSRNFSRSSR